MIHVVVDNGGIEIWKFRATHEEIALTGWTKSVTYVEGCFARWQVGIPESKELMMKPALFFFHFTCSNVSSSGAISFPVNAATSSPEIFLTRRNGRVALRCVAWRGVPECGSGGGTAEPRWRVVEAFPKKKNSLWLELSNSPPATGQKCSSKWSRFNWFFKEQTFTARINTT